MLDYPYDDSTYWAYKHDYLGGSVTFDVNVKEVGCGCAAGVYLAALNDETCGWGAVEPNTTPQCATIDLMEGNTQGWHAGALPCENGSCETEGRCRTAADMVGEQAYGPGSDFYIDTT